MADEKSSAAKKSTSSSAAGKAKTVNLGEGTGPVTEKPVPQKMEVSRYVVSVDAANGAVVKLEKVDDKTGKPHELSREEYAAAFAFSGYPSPLKTIPALGTEKKQPINMSSIANTQGAAEAAASLAAYGIVPDQFGGFSDAFGGHTDATGGYSDAFGGYADAAGGYYDAAGGYTDPYGGYSDTAGGYADAFGGYTDAFGGYSDAAGGYTDAFGGYSDAAGGYTDATGGYSDPAGGYTDIYGGYIDPAGGYTDATGVYTDPASVAYALAAADPTGALSQTPY